MKQVEKDVFTVNYALQVADVSCSICGRRLFEGDKAVENRIFKCGELDSVEFTHPTCDQRQAERFARIAASYAQF